MCQSNKNKRKALLYGVVKFIAKNSKRQLLIYFEAAARKIRLINLNQAGEIFLTEDLNAEVFVHCLVENCGE